MSYPVSPPTLCRPVLQSWPLQTFTAAPRCETGDYRETWDQDQICVNSWEPMGRRKVATVGPGHCRQVASCCGDIASLCRGLPVTGALWHQPAVSELRVKNNTNIIDPLYYGLNIEHFALFVGLPNRQRCGWVQKLICWNWIVSPDKQRAPWSHHQAWRSQSRECKTQISVEENWEREMITIISVFWSLNVATPQPQQSVKTLNW